ncbi:hypothetical protein [Vagococcus fessus]|uniref:Uncharacterized protein n=1 Tax=Vagococcus fessus TaxID=120370 RepID=A0A430A555_9ENTE|nr:hypothetical protein [Vagococcus fessus]RSU01943.1 hypothetical protein CBF31_09250 [Vagococcus fessus]
MRKVHKVVLAIAIICYLIIISWRACEVIDMQRDQIRELTVMNEKLMNSNEVIAGKLNEFIQESE